MMPRVHLDRRFCAYPANSGIGGDCQLMAPGHASARGRLRFVAATGDVLDETAAKGNVQELIAATDREHGKVAGKGCREERELELVALRHRRLGVGAKNSAVAARVDVNAAREKETVARSQSFEVRGAEFNRPEAGLCQAIAVGLNICRRPTGQRDSGSFGARQLSNRPLS